jgi:hypothetical protein
MRQSTSVRFPVLITLALAFAFQVLVTGAEPIVFGTVGIQRLVVASPSSRLRVMSIPFLKSAVGAGRLAGIDGVRVRVSDTGREFEGLQDSVPYLLLVRSGAERGAWFTITPAGDSWANAQGIVLVTNDGTAGSLPVMEGNESFSIHPLFTIAELFPEDGSVLPSGRVDVLASQIHLLGNGAYIKYWLSDGSITDTVGWYCAGPSGLRKAGADPIMPGNGFFVAVPQSVEQSVTIRLFGEVLTDAIRIPVQNGHNLLGVLYNLSLLDSAGQPSFELQDMGLERSGFDPGSVAAAGDQLLLFNAAVQRFDHGFWLDQQESPGQWRRIADGISSGNTELNPVEGMVIWNRGAKYWWRQGN